MVAALSTPWFPFGTALGIFTLILLGKPLVRAQFGEDVPLPPGPAPTPFAGDVASAGWVSTDAKRRFSRQAILVGAALLFIQFAIVIVEGAWALSRGLGNRPVFEDAGSAVPYAERVWFIEYMSLLSEAPRRLANVRTDDDGYPVPGPGLPAKSRFLAADGQSLWILGEKTLARYEAGRLTEYPSSVAPRWPSRPFDYDGHPAFFDWNRRGDEIRMVRLENDQWSAVPGSSWKASDALPRWPGTWAVLPAGSGFDVFMQFGTEVRWRHIGVDDALGDPRTWELVTGSGRYWAAARLGDESVVVLPTRKGLFDGELSLLHQTDAGWVVMRTIPDAAWTSLAAIPSGPEAMGLVLAQSSRVVTLTFSDGAVQTRHTHARAQAAPFVTRAMIPMMLFGFIPALLAAALLGRLVRRDRIGVLEGERPLRFASLVRRGIAYGIDHSVVWIASLAWSWRIFQRLPEASMMQPQLGGIVLVLGSLVGTLLVTSFMEGRWGTTPGKWLLGIRVVDLNGNVCGFWRALLRGALRVFDGAMGFVVGMFVVAFTPSWQRVGDLAAKTIVVRADRIRRACHSTVES